MATTAPGAAGYGYDVIVIGGGINGSAIARDAATRGFRVLLLEKDDLSNATSAWSSRMIHGGIKYLENFEIDLVRESLREREWLLHAAPHLVKPLPFLMPYLRRNRRGPLMLTAGMIAYDVLSFDKSLDHHRLFGPGGALKAAPGLDPAQVRGGALFYDAQAEYAERLSVENAISAREHGARVLTHTRVTRLLLRDRRVIGVEYRDELTGETSTAQGRVTVNATGPWADELLDTMPDHVRPLVGGTKGSHLVVDPFPGAPKYAMYYEAVTDGRPVLVIPWLGRYLIGSTDIRYHGDPGDAHADDDEVRYILTETNTLMPSAHLTPESVRFAYTGVRPLPFEPADDVAKITRHHIVHDHAPALDGLVTIIGGKLTTFRSLAEDAVNRVARKLGGGRRRCVTRSEPLPGGRVGDYTAFAAWFTAESGLDAAVARRLLALYGSRAVEVLDFVRHDPGLGRVVDAGSSAIAAEGAFAIRHEFARTLTDVLMRRTMLGLDPELPVASVEAVAEALAGVEGWGTARTTAEIDAYLAHAKRFRPILSPVQAETAPIPS
jgi:glycerol-3-phosphate dehydrogenase